MVSHYRMCIMLTLHVLFFGGTGVGYYSLCLSLCVHVYCVSYPLIVTQCSLVFRSDRGSMLSESILFQELRTS